jgi:DNA-binding transcriptional regulator YdaS (Cro superfamily)
MTKAEAIAHFGTATALADALGLSKVAVSQWGDYPPRLRQLEIQELTKGALQAEPRQAPATDAA